MRKNLQSASELEKSISQLTRAISLIGKGIDGDRNSCNPKLAEGFREVAEIFSQLGKYRSAAEAIHISSAFLNPDGQEEKVKAFAQAQAARTARTALDIANTVKTKAFKDWHIAHDLLCAFVYVAEPGTTPKTEDALGEAWLNLANSLLGMKKLEGVRASAQYALSALSEGHALRTEAARINRKIERGDYAKAAAG